MIEDHSQASLLSILQKGVRIVQLCLDIYLRDFSSNLFVLSACVHLTASLKARAHTKEAAYLPLGQV